MLQSALVRVVDVDVDVVVGSILAYQINQNAVLLTVHVLHSASYCRDSLLANLTCITVDDNPACRSLREACACCVHVPRRRHRHAFIRHHVSRRPSPMSRKVCRNPEFGPLRDHQEIAPPRPFESCIVHRAQSASSAKTVPPCESVKAIANQVRTGSLMSYSYLYYVRAHFPPQTRTSKVTANALFSDLPKSPP